MLTAALRITSDPGARRVPVDRDRFVIGRHTNSDLVLPELSVSHRHAVLSFENGQFVLRDAPSKFGTFVNGERVQEHRLQHGDRIHLGSGSGVDLTFEVGSGPAPFRSSPATSSAIVDVGHVAALLGGLRALGTGRVLDDVLALVLDAALAVSNAERAFIMLAGAEGRLEFKLARGRGGERLADSDFRSHRVPQEVFDTGKAQFFEDFCKEIPDPETRKSRALELRNVGCVPLVAFDLVEDASSQGRDRRIGVLYLDSRRKGSLVSTSTKSTLDALATNAAVAIENARLYREAVEKARLEQEMQLAAQIQQLLLPRGSEVCDHCEVVGRTLPCRSIAGDFFDYAAMPDGRLVFAVGDVAGKGPPAALLSTLVLGVLAGQRRDPPSPAEAVARLNEALAQRSIEARYVTMVCGQLERDGRLAYCNAGHNPPIVIGRRGVARLDVGGPPAGMFETARFSEASVALLPGDRLVVYTDGVPEARDRADDEFGEQRLVEVVESNREMDAGGLVEAIVRGVRTFASGTPQADDITALVIAYSGGETPAPAGP